MARIKAVDTFDEYLEKQLRDPALKAAYEEELDRLRIGYEIASMRSQLGLTQAQLAKRAKTTQPVISRIEKGGDAKVSTLASLARAMGVDMQFKLKSKHRARIKSKRANAQKS